MKPLQGVTRCSFLLESKHKKSKVWNKRLGNMINRQPRNRKNGATHHRKLLHHRYQYHTRYFLKQRSKYISEMYSGLNLRLSIDSEENLRNPRKEQLDMYSEGTSVSGKLRS